MKKIIFSAILLLFSFSIFSQRIIKASKVTAQSLVLNGFTITQIESDTTLSSGLDTAVPTSRATKKYIDIRDNKFRGFVNEVVDLDTVTAPISGDIAYDSTDQILYIRTVDTWQDISTGGGSSEVDQETTLSSGDTIKVNPALKVLEFYDLSVPLKNDLLSQNVFPGLRYKTKGFNTVGDGGEAVYYASSDSLVNWTVDSLVVIPTANNMYLILDTKNGFDAVSFGVIPDDGLEDQPALQKCIDAATSINNLGISRVNLPPGILNFKEKGVIIFPRISQFVTLEISGSVSTYAANQDIGKVTSINLECDTCFAIGVQKGRHVVIKNIDIQSDAIIYGDNFVEVDELIYGGKHDGTNNPNAGIVIDPFHSNVAAGNRYPGFESEYNSISGISGSSHTTIDGVSFFRLNIAILISPNGTTLNGDNIRATNISVNTVKYFWSCGQAQAKGNSIENIYSVGNCLHFLIGSEHGGGQGKLPTVSNFNLAAGIKYLSSGGIFGTSFEQGFSEGIISFGTSSISISNSQFNLNQISRRLPVLWSGNGTSVLRIENSIIQYYNNCTESQSMLFKGKVEINNSTFGGAEIIGVAESSGATNENVYVDNLNLQCQSNAVTRKNVKFSYPSFLPFRMTTGTVDVFGGVEKQNPELQVNALSGTWTISGDTATIVCPNASRYVKANRTVAGSLTSVDYTNDIYGSHRIAFGVISEINVDTLKVFNVPLGVTSGSGFVYFYNTRTWTQRVIASTTAGSNKLVVSDKSEVNNITNFMLGGSVVLKGIGLPSGTIATSFLVDTIYLSQNATTTNVNAVYGGNADQKREYNLSAITLTSSFTINKVGDIIYNSEHSLGEPFYWFCTKSGRRTGSVLPEWEPVYKQETQYWTQSGGELNRNSNVGIFTADPIFPFHVTGAGYFVDGSTSAFINGDRIDLDGTDVRYTLRESSSNTRFELRIDPSSKNLNFRQSASSAINNWRIRDGNLLIDSLANSYFITANNSQGKLSGLTLEQVRSDIGVRSISNTITTSTYTVGSTDYFLRFDATSTNQTITLPDASLFEDGTTILEVDTWGNVGGTGNKITFISAGGNIDVRGVVGATYVPNEDTYFKVVVEDGKHVIFESEINATREQFTAVAYDGINSLVADTTVLSFIVPSNLDARTITTLDVVANSLVNANTTGNVLLYQPDLDTYTTIGSFTIVSSNNKATVNGLSQVVEFGDGIYLELTAVGTEINGLQTSLKFE